MVVEAGVPVLTFRAHTAADQAAVWIDYSSDLRDWNPAREADFLSRVDYPDGTSLYRFAMPASQPLGDHFARLRVDRR